MEQILMHPTCKMNTRFARMWPIGSYTLSSLVPRLVHGWGERKPGTHAQFSQDFWEFGNFLVVHKDTDTRNVQVS